MSAPQHTIAFHLLTALSSILLIGGMARHVAFWLGGRRSVSTPRPSQQADGYRRLGWLRGASHGTMAVSFLLLFFVGSIGNWLTDHHLWTVNKDTPWFALTNEISGLLLLGTALAAAIRRLLFSKEGPLSRRLEDAVPALWLVTLAATGFAVEGARIAASPARAGPFGASFIGGGLAALLPAGNHALYLDLWWGHAALCFGFLAYLPFSAAFHMVAAPLVPLARQRLLAAPQRVQMDACTRCGLCSRLCEVGAACPEKDISPAVRLRRYGEWKRRSLLDSALPASRKGSEPTALRALADDAFRCTLCARCSEACPVGIDLKDLWLELRRDLSEQGYQPSGLGNLSKAIAAERNIVEFPNEDRDIWVDYADAPEDRWQRDRADVLYFVGCMSSFAPAAQSIPAAFAEILDRAGVDFTILGGEEWCCGFPLLAAGAVEGVEALIQHNLAQALQTGAKTIVFSCPSCFNTWVNDYRPHLPDDVRLLHSAQYLKELIDAGRIELTEQSRTVTYHDPCDLGRNSGVYEEPRAVLRSLAGVEFREAERSRNLAHCCGGGGDLQVTDQNLASTVCAKTLHALEQTGADTLVVACPQCKRMFDTAVKQTESCMTVMDLTELVRASQRETSVSPGTRG